MDAAITDTRAIAHDMQASAQRGLLWAIGLSLLAHLAVLTIQVGGDSFGWRTPSAEAAPDSSQRFNARLVQSAPAEVPPAPKLESTQVSPDPRPVQAPRNTTVNVTAPPTLPRAEELDAPTPKAEAPTPPVERIVPVVPPAPKAEIREERPAPQPVPKEPELVTPKQAEQKTPPPVVTPQPPVPTPTPPPPAPLVEAQPPKPEVKEAAPVPAAITPPPVTAAPTTPATATPEPVKAAPAQPKPVAAPILPAPVPVPTSPAPPVAVPVLPATPVAPATPTPVAAPTPKAAPQAAPATATPAAPATPATAATPVLTGPAPSATPAASATPPAAASAAPASGAPSASGATSGSPATPAAAGTTGARTGAVVSLPSPRTGDGTVATPGVGANGERVPSSGLPPGNIDGFDPYKSRSAVARDAARDLNNQRGRAPPSVAPSLTERERFARDVENARRRDCKDVASEIGLLAIPIVIGSVLLDKGCQVR